MAVQQVDLGLLDRLDHGLRNQLDLVVDARQMLRGVEQQSSTRSQQRTGLGGDDGAVGQLNGGRGHSTLLLALAGRDDRFAVLHRDVRPFQQQRDLVDLLLGGFSIHHIA